MKTPFARVPLIAALWLPLLAWGQIRQPISSRPQPHAWRPPVVALRVEHFKLLTATNGWVSGSHQILFTTDGGSHWRKVTPPEDRNPQGMPIPRSWNDVAFVDPDTGWALSIVPSDEDPDQALFLDATQDGGATWTRARFAPWTDRSSPEGGSFTFADRLHGWTSIGTDDGTSVFYATSDGGLTWSRIAGRGLYGGCRLLATSPLDIWAACGTHAMPPSFAVSHDGGLSFQDVSLRMTAQAPDDLDTSYSLPLFIDPANGYEQVLYLGGARTGSALALFRTTNGGRSWAVDRMLSYPDLVDFLPDFAIAGDSWMFACRSQQGSQPALMKIPPARGPVEGRALPLQQCGYKVSFVTGDIGWVGGGSLSATLDGGAAWTDITPHLRDGVVTTDPVTP